MWYTGAIIPKEAAIISIFRSGGKPSDREFLQKLYQTYAAPLRRRIAAEIPNPEDAEDCLQNCFVRMAGNIGRLRELTPEHRSAYVLSVMRSVVVDYRRRRLLPLSDLEPDEVAGEDVPLSPVEEEVERRERFERLRKNLHKLSETDRIILHYLYREDRTPEELAALLGIRTASLRTYISRAKKRAIRLMNEEGSE